ncbi:hypothetical protein Tco_0913414 [Tanacetum coccineum]
MRGTRGSDSKSTTTKSVGKWKFPTLTKISSATPLGRVIDRKLLIEVANLGIKVRSLPTPASAKLMSKRNLERFGRSSPFDSKLCHGTFDHHVVKDMEYLA